MIFEYLKQHDNVYDFLLEYSEKVFSFLSQFLRNVLVEYLRGSNDLAERAIETLCDFDQWGV